MKYKILIGGTPIMAAHVTPTTSTHPHTVNITIATDDDIKRLSKEPSLIKQGVHTSCMLLGTSLLDLLKGVVETDPCLPRFESVPFNSHITRCRKILKEVQKYPRNDPSVKGFMVPSQKYMDSLLPFISGVVSEGDSSDEVKPEDCLLTCPKKKSKEYRKIIHSCLNVEEFLSPVRERIKAEIEQSIDSLEAFADFKDEVNITHWVNILATKFICAFVGCSNSYEEIGQAVSKIFTEVVNDTKVFSFLTSDREGLRKAQITLRNAIDEALENENPTPFVKKLVEAESLTQLQKKVMIFVAFATGQETTASLLTYLIYKLGMDTELQNQLCGKSTDENNEKMKEIFFRTLKEFTPAPAIMRGVSKCVRVQLINSLGNIEKEYLVKANEKFHLCPIFAAEGIPDSEILEAEWLPFGSGFHECLGQKFGTENISQTLLSLMDRYEITTITKDVGLSYESTLRLSKDIYIHLKKREPKP